MDSRDMPYSPQWRVWPSTTDPGEAFLLYRLNKVPGQDKWYYDYMGEHPFGEPPDPPQSIQQPPP